MRWLMVSRQHHPSHGGIGTYVQRFARAAREAGWHLELVTQPGEDWPVCNRVHEVPTADLEPVFQSRIAELRRRHLIRPYRYALWSLAVAERLSKISGRFDAIEFVDCQAEGFAALGSPQVRQRFADAVFLIHAHTPMFVEEAINGCDPSQFGRAMYHDWERRALEMADGVITTADCLVEALALRARPDVAAYPINDDVDVNSTARPSRILMVGSAQPRKGVDLWARSLNEVLRATPKATAMMVGPDTPTVPDGLSMAAHVQRLLDPRVIGRFNWTGTMTHDRVRDLIATSAVVIVPSRLESFSFVAAEALLAGTPVIVSNRTGIAQHVPSLPQVDVQDIAALATAQIAALDAPGLAIERALANRAEMLDACDPRAVLAGRLELLDRLKIARGGQREIAGDTREEMVAFIASVDSPMGPAMHSLISSERS